MVGNESIPQVWSIPKCCWDRRHSAGLFATRDLGGPKRGTFWSEVCRCSQVPFFQQCFTQAARTQSYSRNSRPCCRSLQRLDVLPCSRRWYVIFPLVNPPFGESTGTMSDFFRWLLSKLLVAVIHLHSTPAKKPVRTTLRSFTSHVCWVFFCTNCVVHGLLSGSLLD